MDDDVFKVLTKQVTNNGKMYWACTACDAFASKFNKRMNELAKDVDAVVKRVDNHDDQLKVLSDEVKSINLARESDKKQLDPAALKSDAAQAVFHEIREREQRRFNVVVHGLPEAPQKLLMVKQEWMLTW